MIIFEDNARSNLLSGLHETGHLVLSELDLAAPEGSKGDIGDLEVGHFDVMWGKL